MNVGILGGTFDPIHTGHLILAEEARLQLGLDEVLFVPAGQPWLKAGRSIIAAFHRVEMVRRAIADNPRFKLCTLEVERSGPSYTVDTLTELRERLGAEANFFFILGRDTLADLPLWKEPDKLLQMCRLVAASRISPGVDLDSLEVAIPGIKNNVIRLDMPVIEVSSSQIRQRLSRGLSIRYLVPGGVERYIKQNKLYTSYY